MYKTEFMISLFEVVYRCQQLCSSNCASTISIICVLYASSLMSEDMFTRSHLCWRLMSAITTNVSAWSGAIRI